MTVVADVLSVPVVKKGENETPSPSFPTGADMGKMFLSSVMKGLSSQMLVADGVVEWNVVKTDDPLLARRCASASEAVHLIDSSKVAESSEVNGINAAIRTAMMFQSASMMRDAMHISPGNTKRNVYCRRRSEHGVWHWGVNGVVLLVITSSRCEASGGVCIRGWGPGKLYSGVFRPWQKICAILVHDAPPGRHSHGLSQLCNVSGGRLWNVAIPPPRHTARAVREGAGPAKSFLSCNLATQCMLDGNGIDLFWSRPDPISAAASQSAEAGGPSQSQFFSADCCSPPQLWPLPESRWLEMFKGKSGQDKDFLRSPHVILNIAQVSESASCEPCNSSNIHSLFTRVCAACKSSPKGPLTDCYGLRHFNPSLDSKLVLQCSQSNPIVHSACGRDGGVLSVGYLIVDSASSRNAQLSLVMTPPNFHKFYRIFKACWDEEDSGVRSKRELKDAIKGYLLSIPSYYKASIYSFSRMVLPPSYAEEFKWHLDPASAMSHGSALDELMKEELQALVGCVQVQPGEKRRLVPTKEELSMFSFHSNQIKQTEPQHDVFLLGHLPRNLTMGYYQSRMRWLNPEKPTISVDGECLLAISFCAHLFVLVQSVHASSHARTPFKYRHQCQYQ